jgi:uncharacterized protein
VVVAGTSSDGENRLRRHTISGEALTALARGHGGPDVVDGLAAGQLSKRLLLIRYITSAWPDELPEREAVVRVISQAQKHDPVAVRRVLLDPLVGAWAARTARLVSRGPAAPTPDTAEATRAAMGHLVAIAASAALRAGIEAELTVRPRRDLLALPTLGAIRWNDGRARVRVAGGTATVSGDTRVVEIPPGAAAPPDGWLGLRRLRCSSGESAAEVTVDDIDPYRDGYHIPAADRLSAAEVELWQSRFDGAWRLLTAFAPDRSAELAVGLRTVVPLADDETGPARSATVRDSFGAFGATLPDSAADFAVTLVHEFQHSKLSALLDLVRLYDSDGDETYFAPWRLDPRPLGGLLQGVYAFLGVADTWRRLCQHAALRPLAQRQFARTREQVADGLTTLLATGRLTSRGQDFALGLRHAVDDLLAVDLPSPVVTEARSDLEQVRSRWRARHGAVGRGPGRPMDQPGTGTWTGPVKVMGIDVS